MPFYGFVEHFNASFRLIEKKFRFKLYPGNSENNLTKNNFKTPSLNKPNNRRKKRIIARHVAILGDYLCQKRKQV